MANRRTQETIAIIMCKKVAVAATAASYSVQRVAQVLELLVAITDQVYFAENFRKFGFSLSFAHDIFISS